MIGGALIIACSTAPAEDKLSVGSAGLAMSAEVDGGPLEDAGTEDPLADSCGYEVSTGLYTQWPGGYQA